MCGFSGNQFAVNLSPLLSVYSAARARRRSLALIAAAFPAPPRLALTVPLLPVCFLSLITEGAVPPSRHRQTAATAHPRSPGSRLIRAEGAWPMAEVTHYRRAPESAAERFPCGG